MVKCPFVKWCLEFQDALVVARWWFQIFLYFHLSWGNDPIWLIFNIFSDGWFNRLVRDYFFFSHEISGTFVEFSSSVGFSSWFFVSWLSHGCFPVKFARGRPKECEDFLGVRIPPQNHPNAHSDILKNAGNSNIFGTSIPGGWDHLIKKTTYSTQAEKGKLHPGKLTWHWKMDPHLE